MARMAQALLLKAMPKISPAAAESRRSRILDAAAQCFARHGVHVSVDEICATAGISKGAIYGYFPSKDAIIQGLADRHMTDLDAITHAGSLEELCALLLARAGNGDASNSRLELEAWTYSLNTPLLRSRLRANTAQLQSALTDAVTNLQANGLVRNDADPAACAAVVETFALGMVAKAALGDLDTAAQIRDSLRALSDLLAQR
jgi:AcrR family transcriptional regulator